MTRALHAHPDVEGLTVRPWCDCPHPPSDGCPACGRDIDRLGGNPDCPTCAAEPAADEHVGQHDLEACAGCRVAAGMGEDQD